AGLTSRSALHLWRTRSLTEGDHLEPSVPGCRPRRHRRGNLSKLVFGRAFSLWDETMYLSGQNRKRLCALALSVGASTMMLPVLAQQEGDDEPKGGKWPQASLRAEASEQI